MYNSFISWIINTLMILFMLIYGHYIGWTKWVSIFFIIIYVLYLMIHIIEFSSLRTIQNFIILKKIDEDILLSIDELMSLIDWKTYNYIEFLFPIITLLLNYKVVSIFMIIDLLIKGLLLSKKVKLQSMINYLKRG